MTFRICALIPTYDNPATLRAVVLRVRRHLPEVIVVDDGSAEPGRRVAEELEREGLARVERHAANAGKGAAVKTGFASALAQGFSHALQVDADGQHDLDDVPRFVAEARAHPEALVLGCPIFDATQPLLRKYARGISTFWVNLETGGGLIDDPQCGFRVYPIAAALAVGVRGDHMEFDQELPVRLVWAGTPVRNLQTRVRYLSAAEGGVSHFDLWRDNLRITRLHTRLVGEMALHALGLRARGTRSEGRGPAPKPPPLR